MAQKKTAAAKTARKTIKAPTNVPARHAAPLLEDAKPEKIVEPEKNVEKVPAKVVEKPVVAVQPRPTPTANAPSKDFGDLAAVGREHLEACVQCGTIEVMSFTQASIEADLAAAKGIMAANTLHEAIELQTSFIQDRIERMTNETTKLGELSMRLAGLAMEPLRSRFGRSNWTAWS